MPEIAEDQVGPRRDRCGHRWQRSEGSPVDAGSGSLTEERWRIPTPHPATPEALAETVREIVDHFSVPGPIGVTLPAVVRSGIVCTAANIDASWLGTDVASLMSGATGREATVLNDADAAGIAEVVHGAGRDVAGVVLMLTLGTGIGSALFVDGVLVPNTELGHLHLHGGDAEDYAAASVKENEDLSWKEFAHRLERYIQHVERLLWPDLIIIGGGVSKKSERFLPLISADDPVGAGPAPQRLRHRRCRDGRPTRRGQMIARSGQTRTHAPEPTFVRLLTASPVEDQPDEDRDPHHHRREPHQRGAGRLVAGGGGEARVDDVIGRPDGRRHQGHERRQRQHREDAQAVPGAEDDSVLGHHRPPVGATAGQVREV